MTAEQIAAKAIATHGPADAARIYREAEAEHWAEAQWCGTLAAKRKEQLAEGYGRIAALIEQYGRIAAIIEQLTGKEPTP